MGAGTQKFKKRVARLVSVGCASILCAGFSEPLAEAVVVDVCVLKPATDKLMGAAQKGVCSDPAVVAAIQTDPSISAACQICEEAMKEQAGAMYTSQSSACAASKSADAAGTAAAESAGAVESQGQNSSMVTDHGMLSKGMESLGLKQSATTEFATKAQQCAPAINSKCSTGVVAAATTVKAATEACQLMASSSAELAANVAKGASTMGDMFQTAMTGASLLGPAMGLYSMFNKGGKSSATGASSPLSSLSGGGGDGNLTGFATAPTPESKNTSAGITGGTDSKNAELGSSNLDPSGSSSAPAKGIGFETGKLTARSVIENSGNGGVKGALASSGSGSNSPKLVGAAGGARKFGDLGKAGAAASADIGAAGGDYSSSGLGGGGSSGASKSGDFKNPGEAAAGAGKDDPNVPYELGGGGSRAILGMKAKGDMEELEGALGPGKDLGLGADSGGDREPASQGSAEREQDGSSLFHMIRLRYAELKKSGHI